MNRIPDIPVVDSGINEEGWIGNDKAKKVLNDGKMLLTNEYHGIIHLWKTDKNKFGYVLLRWQKVVEDKTFNDIDEAVEYFKEESVMQIGR